MQIYHQYEESKFESESTILAINSSINLKEEDNEVGELSINNGSDFNRKLEELRDLNNDGITDMIVLYTKNSGVFDIENNYEIYLGKNIDSKIVYQDEPDSIIKTEGTLPEYTPRRLSLIIPSIFPFFTRPFINFFSSEMVLRICGKLKSSFILRKAPFREYWIL